jgi:hypothetical protein
MATITSRNNPPFQPSPDAVPPLGPGEGALAPTLGVPPGPSDGAEARSSQLSLLVEINAALAGGRSCKGRMRRSWRFWIG